MYVNGDSNCDELKKPQKFQVWFSEKNAYVDSLSTSFNGAEVFLSKPFNPTKSESQFLKDVASNIKVLENEEGPRHYVALVEKLFKQAFSPNVDIEVLVQPLFDLGVLNTTVVYKVHIQDVLDFQNWYIQVFVPRIKPNPFISLPSDNGEIKPLLLVYGTVKRTGVQGNYLVSYDKDVILTAGSQNEVHDTTLCQLQKGIFDISAVPKADIAVHHIFKVTKK